jgi:regulatory protein
MAPKGFFPFRGFFLPAMRKNSRGSCYDRALSLLAAAEHCTKGLERKLLFRGYSEEEVAETLERLAAENILNDRRFAELWIEFRQRRKDEGGRRLAAGLLRRGVNRDTAEEAVKAAARTGGYRSCLLRARENALARGCEGEHALVAFLIRKGFSRSEIKQCVDSE